MTKPKLQNTAALAARTRRIVDVSKQLRQRRAELEGELDIELDDNFNPSLLGRQSIEKYAVASAGVLLADKVAKSVRERLLALWREIAQVAGQASVDLNGFHLQLDRAIEASVRARLPADIGDVSLDFKTSKVFLAELAIRKVPANRGFHLDPNYLRSDGLNGLEYLESALLGRATELEELDAETARVLRALEKYPEAA